MAQQDPLHVLMVEPRFPGRLSAVADWLVQRRGYRVTLFCHQVSPQELSEWPATLGRGLDVVQYNVGGVAREASVPWTRGLERGLCHAYGAWEVFDARRVRPVDLVVGRSFGLGSTLFAPVSYPRLPIVNLFDYHLAPRSGDLWDDDGNSLPIEYRQWRRAANTMDLLDLENGSRPWTLTQWQRQTYPPEYQDDFFVCHDGVNLKPLDKPRNNQNQASQRQVLGHSLEPGMKLVTFVSTSLDRLRGFDRFHRLARRLLTARRDVLIVALGAPLVERSLDIPFHGTNYAANLLVQEPIHDQSRYLMPGWVPPQKVAELLNASDLHVTPGRPYIVSLSMLEAMAAGTPILAWNTAPAREIIHNGENGLLVTSEENADDQAFEIATQTLDQPQERARLALAARQTIQERFDREATMPRLAQFFEKVAGRLPGTA